MCSKWQRRLCETVETVEKGLDLEILAKSAKNTITKMVKRVEIVAHKPNVGLAIFEEIQVRRPEEERQARRQVEIAQAVRIAGFDRPARLLETEDDGQHIYGLLFSLMWPLVLGRPFCSTMLKYPEQLIALGKQQGACTLISSPALLKRLPSEKFSSLTTVKTIFSSS